MDGKLSVLDRAARARWLLGQLETSDLIEVYDQAMRMQTALAHMRGMAHQLALPIAERKWIWEPLVIGAEPVILGDD